MNNGTFAIYPTVDMHRAAEHAVVFCDDIDIAERLCDYFSDHYGTRHAAVLRMPSWPDPLLIHDLNGCEGVSFSTRDPKAADRASWQVREALQLNGAPARA